MQKNKFLQKSDKPNYEKLILLTKMAVSSLDKLVQLVSLTKADYSELRWKAIITLHEPEFTNSALLINSRVTFFLNAKII